MDSLMLRSPQSSRCSPNSGPTRGRTAVTISGTNFATGATVTFGAAAATNVVVVNSTTITATTPAGSIGAVPVTVKVGGQSGTLANGFAYALSPTVSSVSPNSGTTTGGTAVTITGTNFATGATVTFGPAAATSVTVVNSTTITATTPAGSAGAVTVTVTVGAQSGNLSRGFTYLVIPTVISISPNSGATAGGTAVMITGATFATGATVRFGATAATNVVVVNSTTITATTPAGSAGAVTVTVTENGQSGSLVNGFSYAPPPTVASVSPSSGATTGGTAITITGTNFAAGATVSFGAAAATNVVVVNTTTITATTPAGSAGAVTAIVTVNGQSGGLANGFTYVLPPTVGSVSPNSGTTAGGTAVTITGTNFAAGATVTFGASAATNVVVVNGTMITATTPAGSGGPVTVTVSVGGQSGGLASGFSYVLPPTVGGVSPNTGTTTGGTAVTITGANFAAGATVTFGVAAATNVVVANGTTITATTPPGSAGGVTVAVMVGGQSGNLPSGFTYAVIPTVSSVSPNSGAIAGGTAVTITGTNFAAGATVAFGASAATNVVVVNGTTITATTPAGSIGSVTVTVTVNGLSGSLANGFTYALPPTVSSVSPGIGSTTGGTAVTIMGTNFVAGTTVTFGATLATNIVVVNGTTITATTPAGTSGPVTVTAAIGGQSGSLASGFTYVVIPTVSSVSPNVGTTAGGTGVTITGTNFDVGATVMFGATAATNVVVVNSTTITAITPLGAAGAVTVTVTVNAQSGSLVNGFSYSLPPTVGGVLPNSGTTAGGTAVTITGTNFAAGATATFGGAAAGNIVVVDSATITAATPAGNAGAVPVAVTVSGQSGSLANVFTYVVPPTVPTNLAGTAVSASQINLTWTASTDNAGVAGYTIFRNGSQIATTTAVSYSDTLLSAFTTYAYTVAAFDGAGIASAQTAPLSVMTLSGTPTLVQHVHGSNTLSPPSSGRVGWRTQQYVHDLSGKSGASWELHCGWNAFRQL